MKYEVKVSDQADYDLRRIFDYIAVDLQSQADNLTVWKNRY